jgi:hypothetical protein
VARLVRWVRNPRGSLFDAQKGLERPRQREAVAGLVATALRVARGRAFAGHLDPEGRGQVALLRRRGFVEVGPLLEAAEIAELISSLGPHSCVDPYQPALGRFRLASPPEKAHLGGYDWETIVRTPGLLALANRPALVAIAEDFLGARPTLSDLGLWWSFPRASGRESQLFHRDADDLRFLKLFVYLTDVDARRGPHVYVSGSPSVDRCTSRRRYSDEEVEEAFGKEAVTFLCGRAGQGFLVNTAGVHKGLVPEVGRRLVFMAEYSLLPILAHRYRPIRCPDLPPLDPYVNRLFCAR